MALDPGRIDLMMNLGNGRLQLGTSLFVGSLPGGLVVADFNGDQHADIAAALAGYRIHASFGDGQVVVLWGDGKGGLQLHNHPTGMRKGALAAGDLNGDRAIDLIIADERNLTPLFGSTESGGCAPVVLDINRDGLSDLRLARSGMRPNIYESPSGPSGVALLLGDGSGAFIGHESFSGVDSNQRLALATVGDLNGDQKPDLITTK